MQLFISCQQKHLINVTETTSVAQVQEFIAEREGTSFPTDFHRALVTYVCCVVYFPPCSRGVFAHRHPRRCHLRDSRRPCP